MALGVGVIGAGTVGGGVIETLLKNSPIIADRTGMDVRLVHIAELRSELLAGFELNDVTLSEDARTMIADPEVQVVCELIGGEEPAKTFILEAMAAGKHVVTANKMLLATHGPELCAAAVKHGVELRYEGAVAGAIPIIKALRESLAGNRIGAVYGILNGTCNYILTRMSREGLEFGDVLQQAIDMGFAETPPDLDVEGWDTAHKCQILASLSYATEVALDSIHVEGITGVTCQDVEYALDLGYEIKLLAVIRGVNGDIEARVHPTLVPKDHLLASVSHEFNAVYVESDVADATLYYGRGAGKLPTASAVVGDLVDIAARGTGPVPAPFRYVNDTPVRDMGLTEGRYYLRLATLDMPGILGKICTILGNHEVSIASCTQPEEASGAPAYVVLMTHETVECRVRAAIEEIDASTITTEPTHLIRVL